MDDTTIREARFQSARDELQRRIDEKRRRRGKAGRRPNLTEEKLELIVDAVRKGMAPRSAAKRFGIIERAYDRYMKKAREELEALEEMLRDALTPEEEDDIVEAWQPSLYCRFRLRILEAEGDSLDIAIDVVQNAIVSGDADLALKWIKARGGAEYRETKATDLRLQNHDGTADASLGVDLSNLSPKQLEALIDDDDDSEEDSSDED